MVLNVIQQVFESGVQCRKLRSDRGSEFRNNLLRNYLQKKGVRLFFANQNSKASIAERVIRTIRGRLYRYFQKNRTHGYIDVLSDIVDNYNSTPHRSLNGLPPNKVRRKTKQMFGLYLRSLKRS